MAVAAIAASLLIARGREEDESASLLPAGKDAPARVKLDLIREAGL